MSKIIEQIEARDISEITENELTCIRLTAYGKVPAEIAGSLGIDEILVVSHLVSIQTKISAENRLHAVVLAMRLGLI